MNLPEHPAHTAADPDLELDAFVAAFEEAHVRGRSADLADFLPPPGHPRRLDILGELVRVDLEFAWDRGIGRRAEEYTRRFPELRTAPDVLRAVVQEEARLRRLVGEEVADDEFDRRFGVGGMPATRVVTPSRPGAPCVEEAAFEVTRAVPCDDRLPEPGDVVAGFRVTGDLGRGAFGRVYLAHQVDLADRPVAVKVSSRFPGESALLARLQHGNIVPVYSVHRHGPFHVVCMPFLGATTLADLIRDLHLSKSLPASGRQVASTLSRRAVRTATADSAGAPETPNESVEDVPRTFPPTVRSTYAGSSYVELVLWLGTELADGLAHAHERGILHRDVKPANVLLTDEGRPMLLDFNLATEVAGGFGTGTVGGTARYMAPEQLDGLLGRPTSPDARSDVYSLGLVLAELLTGRLPFDDPPDVDRAALAAMRDSRLAGPPRIFGTGSRLTPAVVSILRTALAPRPEDRYPSAAALREDLRRQREHRPLAFAPDPSARERLGKWARRHPRLSSWVTVSSLAVVVVATLVTGFLLRQAHFARVGAEAGRLALAEDRRAVRGLLADRWNPSAELDEAALRSRAALADYPAPDDPHWSDHPLVRPLDAEQQSEVRRLQGELYYLLAGAETLMAQRDPDTRGARLAAARRANALAVACRPEGERVPLLDGQRDWMDALGRGERPQGGRQMIDRKFLRRELDGLYRDAAAEAGSGPYWLMAGKLHLRLGEVATARACFRLATDLRPSDPWPAYHAGVAALEAKDYRAAAAAFTTCLSHRDDVPEAYLNRAIAHIGLGDYRTAISDLDRIEPHARRLPRLYFVRETARRRAGDRVGAERDRAAGIELEPTDAAGWCARGEARLARTPPDTAGAVADFRAALEADPDFPQAYQNLANALSEVQGKPSEAIEVLDRAVERFPDYTPARAGRAVLLARLDKSSEARNDVEYVLDRDPSAIVCYQAACVYLLTAARPDDRARGIALLRRCLRLDPGWAASMPADPDLKSVHPSPEFRRLLQAATELTR